ncbi:MAG TPA: ChaN family lipoprotein [Micavibrio sp.]|jgi:uncharacterized iron-regulated protein
MKTGIKYAVAAFAATTLAASMAIAAIDKTELKDGEILDTRTGELATKEAMIDFAAAARVIYISDPHDNPAAHEKQLEIIRALEEKFPGRIAVGTEMFRRDVQEYLDAWTDKKIPEATFKKIYCDNWGDWYTGHASAFFYMRDHSIPLIGLYASRDMRRDVRSGKIHADDYGIPEIDLTEENHKKYNMAIYNNYFSGDDAHTADPNIYYRMMTFWDEIMAKNVAEFLDNPDNADKKLVVIAGAGHVVYGIGVPVRAAKRHPHDYAIILSSSDDGTEATSTPLTEAEKEAKIPLPIADYVWKIPNVQVPWGQCQKPQ